MIEPLAQKFDGGLGTINLSDRHVQIVNKNNLEIQTIKKIKSAIYLFSIHQESPFL